MKILFIFLFSVGIVLSAYSQDKQQNADKNYLWKFGYHMGSSMLWGDLSEEQDPFTKMFSSQSKLSYEFDLHRKLTEAFWLEGSFLFGKLAGQRTRWSDDQHAGVSFNSSFYDYSLALNVDIMAFFNNDPERLLSIYLLGGAGMTHYSATSNDMSTGASIYTVSSKTFFVPWGWGVGLNLTPRWSVFAQNTFRHPFVDDFDSYAGTGTTTNDIYSFTSVGATYKFGPKKPKKETMEIVPVTSDTSLAVAEAYTPVQVSTSVDMPPIIKQGEEKTVSITINKGVLSEKAEFNQSFPDGFMIEPLNISGGQFSYDVGKLNIRWDELPQTENITVAYKLKTGEMNPGAYNVPGTFVYSEKEKIKVKQFKNNITVEGAAVALNNAQTQENETTGEQATPAKTDNNKPNGNEPTTNQGIRYGVQVAAVYGGKMNPAGLQKRYHLNEAVSEYPYKGYNNYVVGNYSDFAQAIERRKGTKARGAYVVAIKDGVYQGHLYDLNDDLMDKAPFLNTTSTYKVQISASNGRPYPIIRLAGKAGVKPSEIYEDKVSGWYQYTVGKFSSRQEAEAFAKKLRNAGLNDAFVVKFTDGKRSR